MSVLVVENEADCPLGLLGRRGLDAAVVRPYAGEALPASTRGFDGLVVLGGAMNADEDETHPWLRPTKDLIAAAVADELPTLLVCLGHQMAASRLGGRVEVSPDGPMWGVVPVGLTDAGRLDPLLAAAPADARAFHWNGDIVTRLPEGAVVLARDPNGGVQAVRYGPRAWGVQFHPEVDTQIVARWSESQDDDRTPGSVARGREALRQMREAGPTLESTWSPVLDAFIALTRA